MHVAGSPPVFFQFCRPQNRQQSPQRAREPQGESRRQSSMGGHNKPTFRHVAEPQGVPPLQSRVGGATACTLSGIDESRRICQEGGHRRLARAAGHKEAWRRAIPTLEGQRPCAHTDAPQAQESATSFLRRGVHRREASEPRRDEDVGGGALVWVFLLYSSPLRECPFPALNRSYKPSATSRSFLPQKEW
ncbi:hypothetical protein NDU88_003592 [Pleurodeles waltl]|uniref:Uncharacterized protein n=1 Tax=Pleurodeles waltl TaxID=8319 RepID=A0AAV7MUQ9_PLEWA|nr:hypothetical protein NDU88_003592 [Pleurodeles waltl]